MRLTIRSVVLGLTAVAVFIATPANAQYKPYGTDNRATGETWNVEFGVGVWQPQPDIVVSSVSLDIIGSQISGRDDLGLEQKYLKYYNLIVRPAKKHKFRFGYAPITYTASTVMKREIIFNGQKFAINVPVSTNVEWKTYRFGYEYDMIYRSRGFFGVILEGKYTDASVTLSNPFTTEWAKVKAPIPTVGAIVRVYPVADISLTAEGTGFKLPTSINALQGYDGEYLDARVYATVNFSDHFGIEGGYRWLTIKYRKDLDRGDLDFKAPYLMGVVRF